MYVCKIINNIVHVYIYIHMYVLKHTLSYINHQFDVKFGYLTNNTFTISNY